MKHILLAFATFAFLLSFNASLPAQTVTLTKELRDGTIYRIIDLLKARYAYPDIAAKMEADLRLRQKRGDYDSLTDGDRFAEQVTADLRKVFDDKHLKLSFSAKPIPVRSAMAGEPSPEEIEQARIRQRRQNFGVPKVEILAGNVGLIQINYFAPLNWSADTYAAAMNYVANTDALIIDLRRNGGSMDINTMPFVVSYLFDEPVQFSDIVMPGTTEPRQLWTYAQVPGKKYGNKNVYVLISQRTASGAEAFVSAMKRLKRAAVIGETTMGATMPGGSQRVNDHFSIWISTGRSSTGKAELENKGVEPDTDWKAALAKVRAGLNAN